MALDHILAELANSANRPIETAETLISDVYISPELYDRERSRIFLREWQCVGRVDQLVAAGDYMTASIDTIPIYVTRGADGQIMAYRNTCSHRNAVLLEGSGNAKIIVCPYHAWTYVAATGELRGAPHMRGSKCFRAEESGLQSFRTEVWEGWIYVTQNEDAPAVSSRLQSLREVLGNYRMSEYKTIHCEDFSWNCNWKVLVENFVDEYHPFWAHRETFGELVKDDIAKIVTWDGDPESWTLHFIPVPADFANKAREMAPTLDLWHSRRTALFAIYPTHLVTIIPGGAMFWLLLQPEGVDCVNVRYGLSVPERYFELSGENPEELRAFFDRVNVEDKTIVEKVFRGLRAAGARQGPLSLLEWSSWEFQKYLARRLIGPHHD